MKRGAPMSQMKSFPYFRWWPADADTDENYTSLSDAELGFFHRCLNRSWINDGLPEDLNELARTMKVTKSYLNRMWPRVSLLFSEHKDGRLGNRRQEQERQLAIHRSDANRRPGNANAAKDENATETRSRSERDANGTPRAYDSGSGSSSGVSSNGKTSLPLYESDAQFAAWKQDYEATGAPFIDADWTDAYAAWRHLDFEQKLAVVNGFRAQRSGGRWQDASRVKKPGNYIRDREYDRAVAHRRPTASQTTENVEANLKQIERRNAR